MKSTLCRGFFFKEETVARISLLLDPSKRNLKLAVPYEMCQMSTRPTVCLNFTFTVVGNGNLFSPIMRSGQYNIMVVCF